MPSKDDAGQYVPPYEGVREEDLLYVHYQDDPWTAVNDAGFREFYDLNTDPYELRNLAYYGEVSQATLDRLEGRLLRLRGCKAEGCRAAEDDTTTPPPPPTGPPSVVSTSPTANATEVAPRANVTATFSEDMLPSSINSQTFKLFKKGSTTKIAATVSYDAGTDTATLNPFGTSSTLLSNNTTYKAVVTTGAKDLAGNPLDQKPIIPGSQQMAWFFTVR